MSTGAILAVAIAVLGQEPATPDQRTAGLALVGTMAAGLVVTLVLLRWVGKKEKDKAKERLEGKQE
jgi:Mg2+/citrate symporter